VPQVFSATTINARKRVVSELLKNDITSPEVAIKFEPKASSEAEYFFAMKKAKALRSTPEGLTYLDVERFENYTSDRNARIVGVLGGVLAGLGGLLLIGRQKSG